jgi:hypothetical protein
VNPTWGDGTLSLVILLPIVLIAASAGLCMYAYCRHGKLLRHERRFQYIEVSKCRWSWENYTQNINSSVPREIPIFSIQILTAHFYKRILFFIFHYT